MVQLIQLLAIQASFGYVVLEGNSVTYPACGHVEKKIREWLPLDGLVLFFPHDFSSPAL